MEDTKLGRNSSKVTNGVSQDSTNADVKYLRKGNHNFAVTLGVGCLAFLYQFHEIQLVVHHLLDWIGARNFLKPGTHWTFKCILVLAPLTILLRPK